VGRGPIVTEQLSINSGASWHFIDAGITANVGRSINCFAPRGSATYRNWFPRPSPQRGKSQRR
jgi:hypothetical protein